LEASRPGIAGRQQGGHCLRRFGVFGDIGVTASTAGKIKAELRHAHVDGLPNLDEKPAMAKKPGSNPKGEFAFFNVVYEDGTQRSNRRVPAELLGGLDGDEPARGFIMEQDREIAEKSGRPPLAIKSISQVGVKKK
jgi:hypothetical protein